VNDQDQIDRDRRARDIFLRAVEIPSPGTRTVFVEEACRQDVSLRSRVEALLKSHQQDSFLEPSVEGETADRSGITPVSEKPGMRIGRYKLLQQIGEGGMGIVYMADQEEPVRRRVALKIIKVGMDTKSVIARFGAERQALAMMDHPNIAKVFDAGATEAGRPYFVMELVRGLRITDYCDETSLSLRARLGLFMQVCHAIQHAHQKGIIHRDIKPSNILVSINDGAAVPKVIDFGIAKAANGARLTDKTVFTAFEQFIGTPAYMSPEQALMTSIDIDTRSDIYSLGVLLYELLTGKTPFGTGQLLALGLDEMRRAIREEEPERPSTRLGTMPGQELSTTAQSRGLDAPKLVSQLRGDLDWIVMKALEKDRARRYETAGELAADLERHLQNEPVSAGPPSRLYWFQKLVRRNKLAFAAVGAVTAALIAGLTVSTILYLQESAARVRAVAAESRMQVALAEAKQQAAIAKAVKDFLQDDLIKQADSSAQVERGFEAQPDLTVKEALRRAAEKIGQRFTNQPMVEAEIHQTIAEAFNGVGERKLAIPHYERALALRKQVLGSEDRRSLWMMLTLARIYQDMGRLEEAIRLFGDTLKVFQAKFGLDDPDTLTSMTTLAQAYSAAGRLPEAIQLQEETLKRQQVRLGIDHADTLWSMNNLAMDYREAGRSRKAIQLQEKVVKLRKAKLGADHPDTIGSMSVLALAYRTAGRTAEAVRLDEETRKLRLTKLGLDHLATLKSVNHQALDNFGAGPVSAEVRMAEETLKLNKAKLGADHPDTIGSMNRLAAIYRGAGRTVEAVQLAEEALKFSKANLGSDHPGTLNGMTLLAILYSDAGRTAEALHLFEETLKLRQARLGSDHPATLSSMNTLAVAYQDAGRKGEALQLFEETLKLRRSKLGADHPDTIVTMNDLALAYKEAGRTREAIQLQQESVRLSKARTPIHEEPVARNPR
jgi:serine/threonine protein kinase